MARVVVDHLTKVFSNPQGATIRAVDDASLTVEDKELLVLVGPSGCGKTTTLRLIAGLEEPTSGTVAIDGTIVNHVPPKDRDIAMVFQNYALYPHMSAYENMAFGLKLRKISKAETDRRVQEASDMLDLAGYLDRRPQELSGGQRQRVALGRALVRRPKVLLLDEPLSGLDARLRGQMRAEIARLHKRIGLTMLYVTHDQMEAMTLGQHIAVMKNGAIQQVAEPIRIYRRPGDRFVAGFFGSPPMNFFRGEIIGNGSGVFFKELPAAQFGSQDALPAGETHAPLLFSLRLADDLSAKMRSYIGKQVVLGIRPEDMKPAAIAEPSQQRIEAIAERVEPLGAETHLHLASAAHSLVVRVQSCDGIVINEKISLVVAMKNAHFFDPRTEKAIGLAENH